MKRVSCQGAMRPTNDKVDPQQVIYVVQILSSHNKWTAFCSRESDNMDYGLLIKAGFLGFALSLGVLMLVFYVVGSFLRVWQKNFVRVFILAAVVSFVVVDLFLYYKIRVSQIPNPELFLTGCVGGWLGGIFSGLTQMKRFLLSLHK